MIDIEKFKRCRGIKTNEDALAHCIKMRKAFADELAKNPKSSLANKLNDLIKYADQAVCAFQSVTAKSDLDGLARWETQQ